MRIASAFEWTVPRESLIIACLFHDIGKVGDHENDLYIPQTDNYKLEKYGDMYTYNKEMKYMTTVDRSMFLMTHFGIKLTQDEWLAIRLNDGQYAKENEAYKLREPLLADIVHHADVIATKQEKGLLP